jgi:hypothetical protein
MATKSLTLWLLAGRLAKLSTFATLVLAPAWACSSSSSGSGGGSADCASLCQRKAALACPKDGSEADCETKCKQTVPGCEAQTNAYMSCVASAQFVCDANTGEATTRSCLQQALDFGFCALGSIGGGDGGLTIFGEGGLTPSDSGTVQTCVGNACAKHDIAGTPECESFCTKIRTACGPTASCNESFWCEIRSGECEASTRARLACKGSDKGGTVMCTANGWSITDDQCPFTMDCPDGG